MGISAESAQNIIGRDALQLPTYEGNSLRFEGINIQLDRGQWEFGEDSGKKAVDTYSIWSPTHHEEISERLKNGERAAAYIMGNFGVVEVRRPGELRQEDAMFDKIKKRERSQNFVAFVNPDDVRGLIDVNRLPEELKDLRWASSRHNIYPGPMHVVLPIKKNAEVDKGVIRQQDNTLAAFWIPGHWGFESLGDSLRKKVKLGLLGGGSLNVHEEDPSYTKKELYASFLKHPEWIDEIDMIIFDEIAEAARIGRSQTMVSFAEYPPKVVRIGSLSPQSVEMHLGMQIALDDERYAHDPKYFASSKNKYSLRNNEITDGKMQTIMKQMARYKEYYKRSLKGDSQSVFSPWGRAHHTV